jgi:hypothetical protein
MEQEHSTIVTNAMQTRSKKTRDNPLPPQVGNKLIPMPQYMYAPGQPPQIVTLDNSDGLQEVIRQGYDTIVPEMKQRTRKLVKDIKRSRANASGASVAPSKKRKKFK